MADAVNLDEYNGTPLKVAACTFLALTYVSVGLRTYVRSVLTQSFQTDDWLMLVSLAIFTLSSVFVLLGIRDGVGFHDAAVLPQDRQIRALMWQSLNVPTYALNMMFIKLSIATFLLRLSVQRRYKWILWVSMSIITVWSLVSFFWDLFQCNPIQAQWDFTIQDFQCATPGQIVSGAYAFSIMTILTDWLYALMPIPMVWKVQMTKQAKASVVVILGLGIFASVATLIRLKFLADINDETDLLFAGTDALIWTVIEPGVAIVAASLATIRPLLRALRVTGFQSTQSSRGGYIPSTAWENNLRRANYANGKDGTPGSGPNDITLIDIETGLDDGAPLEGASKDASVFGTKTTTTVPEPVATAPSRGFSQRAYRISHHREAYLASPDSDSDGPQPGPSATSSALVIEGAGSQATSETRGASGNESDSGPAYHSQSGGSRMDRRHSDDEEELIGLEASSQHSGRVGLGATAWNVTPKLPPL